MASSLKFEGGKELEKALMQLPAGTAKSVARRVMKRRLQPVAAFANALWPGSADDVFKVTSRVARSQIGDSQMKRDRATVNMFVGAPGGRFGTPEAHLIEFGTGPRYHRGGKFTGSVAPQPMLQPAWDVHSQTMLKQLGADLFEEITKSIARRNKRAAGAG